MNTKVVNNLIARIEMLENKILLQEASDKLVKTTPLWKQILSQSDFWNNHGKMRIPKLKLSEITRLLVDLQDNCTFLEDIFDVRLIVENTCISGSIYDSSDKLWLTIDEVIIDEGAVNE